MDCHGCNDTANEQAVRTNNTETGCNIYENPVFGLLFDNAIRPGGYAITDRAMELCGFQPGAKLLDVGCGCGGTVEYLGNVYNMEMTGIDPSDTLINRGKSRNPGLDIKSGDGEYLEFPSLSFDGVLMECTLSLMGNQTEALHEAYCVLKNGGKLVISDFYLKDGNGKGPFEMVKIKQLHRHGDFKDHDSHGRQQNLRSCIDGAFHPGELKSLITDIGFHLLIWEDKEIELKNFTSSLIMNYGSLENFFHQVTGTNSYSDNTYKALSEKKLGYFLMVAGKA